MPVNTQEITEHIGYASFSIHAYPNNSVWRYGRSCSLLLETIGFVPFRQIPDGAGKPQTRLIAEMRNGSPPRHMELWRYDVSGKKKQ